MPRIPFIEARFFNPDDTTYTLEKRFVQHLRDLRSREQPDTSAGAERADISEKAARRRHATSPSEQERARIKRRADLLIERRKAASGMGHLTREHRDRLAVLRDGVRLVAITTEHQADELAAELHGEMPWMASATETVWQAMRRSVREGWPGLRLPPMLLDGPPGVGKSHWARRLGQLLTVPTAVVEATSENASFGVVGSQRGWGSAYPGRVLETILQAGVANPILVVDEVEKAGKATSNKGHTFGLAEALLPLLEPMTAKRWNCPYYQVKFDMSWVGWVLTSNNYRLLPEPLLSRCPPVRLRELTPTEVNDFVRREGAKRHLSAIAVQTVTEAVDHAYQHGMRIDLRIASRLLQRAEDLERQPVWH
ncbi:AAA family ATPase [Leisingera daeponensis]|uniref:AAA family ATPase n=1 Tax=Leisingera daeponensis TaxID=405746 RepID=A0ABS7NN75_9RHOB|nr:AAA family ATPase [Leisingera daeponensis]MBY6142134.1 AAA family ATPase [Leisingera daeponensis]